MDDVVMIQIPVDPQTALVLDDERRREAVGKLLDAWVRPATTRSFSGLFESLDPAAEPRSIDDKLLEREIEAELEVYNAERRG